MQNYRNHNCSELNISNLNEIVFLSGWVHKRRDHGNLLFIDLRDNYGLSQCVIDSTHKDFKKIIYINFLINGIVICLFSLNDSLSILSTKV